MRFLRKRIVLNDDVETRFALGASQEKALPFMGPPCTVPKRGSIVYDH